MKIPITKKEITDSFRREGYTVISIEPSKSAIYGIVNFICPNKHKHKILYTNWKNKNYRCAYCAGNARLKLEDLRIEFEKENYVLLDNVYINNSTHLQYVCTKGHKHKITYNNWKNGYRCPYCAGQGKPVIDLINSEFASNGYKLLSTIYKNSKSCLHYICNMGHTGKISWNNWRKGKRCPTCANIKMSGPGHPNWKGGISCEPYCQDWTKEYKEFIKERDGNKCLNPDCWGTSERLAIHHIDYNKKNCKPYNLITLCTSCNTRANTNRKWHEAWYKSIIFRRYGAITKKE